MNEGGPMQEIKFHPQSPVGRFLSSWIIDHGYVGGAGGVYEYLVRLREGLEEEEVGE